MLYRERGMSKPISLLGIPIDTLTRAEVLARCREALIGTQLMHIVTANPEILLRAHADPAYADLLRRAELIIPDGVGVLVGARLLGQHMPGRIPGIELIIDLSRLAAREGPENPAGTGQGRRVYLLGGRSGVAEKTAERLREEIPNLAISAFAPDHDVDNPPPELWKDLQEARPAMLFVAYGAPRQERWIAQHRERLEQFGVRVAMGVGGAFDTLAGKFPRAPQWMRVAGLEWLWRLWVEPQRFPRILRATLIFPCLVIGTRLFRSP